MADNQKNLRSLECHCGEWHIIDVSIPEWRVFWDLVQELGENTEIQVIGHPKKYSVPRIFIAVHGVKASEIPKLGFKQL